MASKCRSSLQILRLSANGACRDNKEGVQSFLEKRPPKFSGTMDNDAPAAYPWWNPIDTAGKPKAELGAKSKL